MRVTQQQEQEAEVARLELQLVAVRQKIAAHLTELAQVDARICADNKDIFTLCFADGQRVPLEVRGAANREQARVIAQQAVSRRKKITVSGDYVDEPINYVVLDGDQTNGQAEGFSLWCSAAAQEMSSTVCPDRQQ